MISRRATLLAAPALILSSKSRAFFPRGIVGVAPTCSVTAPSQAAAVGYTNCTFFDGFDSLATIDTTNSGAPGFKWYGRTPWPTGNFLIGAPNFDMTTLSISGSILHFNNTNPGARFGTACDNGIVNGFNGQTFTNGAYFESLMAFNPANESGSPADGWPAFWSISLNSRANPAACVTGELDFFEAFPNGAGAIAPLMSVHDTNWPASRTGSTSRDSSNNNVILPGSPTLDLTHFHKYGTLWIPTTQNGGVGLIKRYFDDIHIVSGDLSYTFTTDSTPPSSGVNPPPTNGVFSSLENPIGQMVLIAGAKSPNVLYVDHVAVWQLP